MSYIANELLENAMKFNYAPSEYPISVGMHLDQSKVRFYVTNSIDPDAVAAFQDLIKKAADRGSQRIVYANLDEQRGRTRLADRV